jgi:peroxiredoxin
MRERISTEFGSPPNFPLLADSGLKVIGRYGLLNPERYKEWIVPHPAVFVIDRQGTIRWRFSNKNARIRPANEDILLVLKELEKD